MQTIYLHTSYSDWIFIFRVFCKKIYDFTKKNPRRGKRRGLVLSHLDATDGFSIRPITIAKHFIRPLATLAGAALWQVSPGTGGSPREAGAGGYVVYYV